MSLKYDEFVLLSHRRHIPFFIILSLLGVISDTGPVVLFHDPFSPIFLIPTVLLGVLTGSVVSYKCALWISQRQSQGSVQLNLGRLGIIAVLSAFLVLFLLKNLIRYNWILHPCVLLGLIDPVTCDVHLSVFLEVAIFIFLLFIYAWGVSYEKRIGQKLVYRWSD